MRIAIYCSSRDNVPQCYKDDAALIGSYIGNRRHTLVYGGIGIGLMKVVASAVRQSGGRIVGVVPVTKRQMSNRDNDENILVRDLNERKAKMITISDLFVVLPGGYGTLDELVSTFSFLTFIGDCGKRIIIVDRDGLFEPFLSQLKLMEEKGLMSSDSLKERIMVVSSACECCELIGHIERSYT